CLFARPSSSVDSLYCFIFLVLVRPPPISTLFPYTTLFRSRQVNRSRHAAERREHAVQQTEGAAIDVERHDDLVARPEVRLQDRRSEEHTSELQSRENLVCRLLLEKKKKQTNGKHEYNILTN